MSDDTRSAQVDPNSVRKFRIVEAPQALAWRVFTERMSTWWPLAHYKIGKVTAVEAVIEPRVGGRWFERGEDGSTCDWGEVLIWEPPSRLVLAWSTRSRLGHHRRLAVRPEAQDRSRSAFHPRG